MVAAHTTAHTQAAASPATPAATAGATYTALQHGNVQHVTHFSYLGSIIEADGGQDREVNRRLAVAGHAFYQLHKSVFRSRSIRLSVKMSLYKSIVVPALVYGSGESWALTAAQVQRLNVFNTACLRRILGISLLEHVSNEKLYKRAQQPSIGALIRCYRLRWLGHVARREDDRVLKQLLFAHSVPGGRVAPGRPPQSWRAIVQKDLEELESQAGWYDLAQVKSEWLEFTG